MFEGGVRNEGGGMEYKRNKEGKLMKQKKWRAVPSGSDKEKKKIYYFSHWWIFIFFLIHLSTLRDKIMSLNNGFKFMVVYKTLHEKTKKITAEFKCDEYELCILI